MRGVRIAEDLTVPAMNAEHSDTFPADDPGTELRVCFGDSLRYARHQARLTQATLASRAGLTQQYVAKIENGQINTTLATMTALAAVLGEEVSDMPRPPRSRKG